MNFSLFFLNYFYYNKTKKFYIIIKINIIIIILLKTRNKINNLIKMNIRFNKLSVIILKFYVNYFFFFNIEKIIIMLPPY